MTSKCFHYILKVTLKYSKPPVWRRLSIPCDINLHDLHNIIQVAMGWNNSHLHAFTIAGEDYSDHAITSDIGIDERKVSLNRFAKVGTKFSYEYDFGASWVHEIIIEEIEYPQSDDRVVICLKGSKTVIHEDELEEDYFHDTPVFNMVALNKNYKKFRFNRPLHLTNANCAACGRSVCICR